ncbi:uncharacterized protein TNCT_3031 [Trichonephila clavata]|uniref:Uncharacterized protein n=1 Tax=Trichonephila clavata TaxID=2740835 RepID=A0A8X6KDK1_TRICU|nr:uncharacterized protein TNCT_3031 [Trichonephila clavata]
MSRMSNERILTKGSKIFSENSSCATVYDLYHFYCLRKSLFDFEASGITTSVPSQTIEKFCLQLKLSIINGIAVIVFTLLYSVSVLICCIILRFLKRRLTSIFRVPKKQGHKEKKTFWKSLLSSAKMQLLEYCDKKVLKKGTKKPWQELDFTTNIGILNKKDKSPKKSYKFLEEDAPIKPLVLNEDNKEIIEEKRNKKSTSRTSIKVADAIKSDATEFCYSTPEIKKIPKKEEEKCSSYAEAGTYVCFDSEESSNESDFDLLDK